MYLHQPRGPGVKNLWCCETKLSIAGVKKGSYSRKKLHLGLAFCRAGTWTPRLIGQKQKHKTGKGTCRVRLGCIEGCWWPWQGSRPRWFPGVAMVSGQFWCLGTSPRRNSGVVGGNSCGRGHTWGARACHHKVG